MKRHRNDGRVGIAYIYCNFRRPSDQKAEKMLASLARQLCTTVGSTPATLRKIYEKHEGRGTRPSIEETLSVLRDVTASYTTVFIVIDALDECQEDDGQRSKFLSQIKDLQSQRGIKLLATSRHILDIEAEFEGSPSVEILAVDDDVRRFVEGRISRSRFVRQSPELADEAKNGIVQSAQGM